MAIKTFRDRHVPAERAAAQAAVVEAENQKLRAMISVMQAETYAARLAAKYLDKELAGRFVS